MGHLDDGAYVPPPPESQPSLLHRGILGGGTMRAPEFESDAAVAPTPVPRPSAQPPALKPAGTRRIFGALALFAVIVVALATWGRDGRSARAVAPETSAPIAR